MIKKYLFVFFILFIAHQQFGQNIQLSNNAEISIITVGPGQELYEGFGHSSIRIYDKKNNIDLAYNYGIFDWEAPNFYLNFCRGKMLYQLASYPFFYFVKGYKKDNRWIKEQILNLSYEEKQQFYEYLENNSKPENASYLYDPFFNNCSSKIREIIDIVLKNKVIFDNNHLKENKSFRQLMNDEYPWNTWGSLGINIALGSKLDKITTAKQRMYLPDFVFEGFQNATINNNDTIKNLVKNERIILDYKEQGIKIHFFNPLAISLLILFLGLYITYQDINKKQRSKWLDFFIFSMTGFIGLIIVFLWFFTNHSTTPNNFNILWAFAPNLIVVFLLSKKEKNKWLKNYIGLLIIFIIAIPIVWIGNIQLFPTSIIPFLILLFIRYIFLYKKLLPSHK